MNLRNLFKPRPIETLQQECLYETRRALLAAEAELERATAAVQALRARERRLSAKPSTGDIKARLLERLTKSTPRFSDDTAPAPLGYEAGKWEQT